jgi:dipeptidyl aminopeptidase/acylaminoacyl peptidase
MEPGTVTDRLTLDPALSGSYSWTGNAITFTPNQPWPNGISVRVRLAPGAHALGMLSLPMRQGHSWSFKIGNPRLVYLYPANGPASLYVIDPISGDTKRLTETTGEVLDFSVNFVGSEIYYTAYQTGSGSTIYRLDMLAGKSSVIIELPQALCRYAQVSPQGDYLSYERTTLAQSNQASAPQVWLLPLASKNTPGEPPTMIGAPDHVSQQPFWSFTGLLTFYDPTLFAFMIYDPRTRQTQEIPSQTGQPGTWDPQGKNYLFPEILFNIPNISTDTTGLTPIPASHLLHFDRLNQQVDDLTLLDNLEDASPAFSPDGKTIIFARKYLNIAKWMPGRQIWIMDADGANARAVTDEPQYNHYSFTWSPAGDQVAYVRFNQTVMTESPEIWLMNADGTNRRLLVSGGYAPMWIP